MGKLAMLFFISFAVATGLAQGAEAAPLASGKDKRPNLLILMPDQQRWDWAGFDGPSLRVPNVAALAASGTRFSKAFTPSPLCETARSAIAAGMEYDENPDKTRLHNYPCEEGKYPTFYKALQEAGYHTMMAGKDHLSGGTGVGITGSQDAACLGWTDYIRTNDKYQNTRYDEPHDPYGAWLAKQNVTDADGGQQNAYAAQKECYGYFGRGGCTKRFYMKSLPFVPLDRIMFDAGAYSPETDIGQAFYVDDWVRNASETLFQRRPQGTPWFMQVGFPGPHPPFIITSEMNKTMGGRTYPGPIHGDQVRDDIQQEIRRHYAAEIENIDRLVGEILDYLRQAGELDNTIVVYTSDHGDELGDYNFFGKVNPWDGSARVPLIVSGPGLRKGHVEDSPTETLDVVGTLLEAADAKPYPHMTTRSLLPMLRDVSAVTAPPRDYVTSGLSYHLANREWRFVVHRFNASSTLKLVCCPSHRCPDNPFVLFDRLPPGEVQLLEVSDSLDRQQLLPAGIPEALQLAQHLPEAYREKCTSLINKGHYHATRAQVVDAHGLLWPPPELLGETESTVLPFLRSSASSEYVV